MLVVGLIALCDVTFSVVNTGILSLLQTGETLCHHDRATPCRQLRTNGSYQPCFWVLLFDLEGVKRINTVEQVDKV